MSRSKKKLHRFVVTIDYVAKYCEPFTSEDALDEEEKLIGELLESWQQGGDVKLKSLTVAGKRLK